MDKQEFLKRAVRNMDRDVEYDHLNFSKEAYNSDGDKENGPTNFHTEDTEGRFS